MKQSVTILLLLLSSFSQAQQIVRERLIPGRNLNDPTLKVRAIYTHEGNILLTCAFGPLPTIRNYLRVLSPALDTIRTSPNRIAFNTDWPVALRNGTGYAILSTNSSGPPRYNSQVRLLRYSNNPAFPLWSRNYNINNSDREFNRGLLEAADGYFIVAGHDPSTATSRAQWTLIKTDTAGAVQWQKMYGRTINDFPAYTCYTQDGNILMTGMSSPPPSFGLVLKMLLLSPAGDSLRGLNYAPFGPSRAVLTNENYNDRTLPLRDGGFVVYSRVDTMGGTPPQSLPSIPVVLKVDAQLRPQWTFAYRPPIGGGLRNAISFAGMCELSDGSVLVLSANSAGTTPNLPYTLLRISPTGRLTNTYPLVSNICAQVQPHKLLPDGDSAVYVFGRCVAGSPTFGELYAARIRLRGLPGIVTATKPPQAGAAGAVALEPPFPNPAAGSATVAYRRPAGSPRAALHLTNVLGQIVRAWPLAPGGSGSQVLNLAGLPPGVYFCALRVPGWPPATRRLVVAP